jgi:hypothetical protein
MSVNTIRRGKMRSFSRQSRPGGIESQTRLRLAFRWRGFPAEPCCPGPVVTHADGTCECQGGCPALDSVRHSYPAAILTCGSADIAPRHVCPRCARRVRTDAGQVLNLLDGLAGLLPPGPAQQALRATTDQIRKTD